MPPTKSDSAPAEMRPAFDRIMGLIEPFCRERLNDEWLALCRQLAAALARKRPSPLARGKPKIWACAVVYALGTVNFLFDRSQDPHIRADELCEAFGVSQSSASSKAKLIRNIFKMHQLDPNWCLPSKMDSNPLVWMLTVNGLIVDVRYMPREVQEIAYAKGLIPYIPADRAQETDDD